MLAIDPEIRADLARMFTDHMTVPTRDETLDENYACYNVHLHAVCYDFPYWLIDAEMRRRRARCADPLKVYFYHGVDGNSCLDAYRKPMFYNVMRPMLALIGAHEDERAKGGRIKLLQSSIDIVRAYEAGEEVPIFRAPYALDREFDQRPIVITLRETTGLQATHKNSDLAAWLKFADDLKRAGERVVFVRDYARAADPLDGWTTYPQASFDLHFRMALYERAKFNLFVSNGPVTLCYFSKLPWAAFIMPEPDDSEYEANTPRIWREKMGVEIGDQFPWSDARQRIVWEKDTYRSLNETWEKMRPLL